MKRYAFIDVPNTKGSAAILGFKIAPQKFIEYLKDEKWSCSDVYWYSGRIHNERDKRSREELTGLGYVMRDKETHFFRRKNSIGLCGNCGKEAQFVMKDSRILKANCDVELTVDCIELAGPDTEFLLFTGDGDFRYLIEKLIEKGSTVRLFSTSKTDAIGDYRLSTRLKGLIEYHKVIQSKALFFTDLNNIRNRIGI